MKRFCSILSFSILLLLAFAAFAVGADPVPVTDASAAAAPSLSTFQSAVAWVTAHQAIIFMLIVAVLDFIFALNPKWESNGALHFLYVLAKGKTAGQRQDE